MSSSWIRVGLKTRILKRKREDTQRRPCKDGGRDWKGTCIQVKEHEGLLAVPEARSSNEGYFRKLVGGNRALLKP